MKKLLQVILALTYFFTAQAYVRISQIQSIIGLNSMLTKVTLASLQSPTNGSPSHKANYDISGHTDASRVVLEALKQYSMIVADHGSNW